LRSDRRDVLYVGRIEPRKGVDCLVRAIAAVQRRFADVHLVIVGDGPDRGDVESLARDLAVSVTFTGRVEDDELAGYYQSADIVCSPALGDESFGVVLLEAMAAGRPIVASDIAGYSELLTPAGSARLAEAGNADSFARNICAVLEDGALARELGQRGSVAAGQYDWSVVARRLEAIYAAACGSGTSGRNEYASEGENTSDASDRFERPLTR
jgi:phosphatidylinositol alpha-mannosyltransferase